MSVASRLNGSGAVPQVADPPVRLATRETVRGTGAMDVKRFKARPLLGILRGVGADAIEPLAETMCAAGLTAVEITMNTPGAPDLIRRMVDAGRGRLMIGAGTVLTLRDLDAARQAGAKFIVLPTLVHDVVERCVRDGTPVFPGALTPQEIYDAWRAGATMVKVFPAKFFGPEYFREVRGPFHDVELLACGGVTSETIGEFFAAGASAVAFGAGVFRPEWLAAGDFKRIGDSISDLVKRYRRFASVPS